MSVRKKMKLLIILFLFILNRAINLFACSDSIISSIGRDHWVIKVAAVQTAPITFNLARGLKKDENFDAKASSQGAVLIAFP